MILCPNDNGSVDIALIMDLNSLAKGVEVDCKTIHRIERFSTFLNGHEKMGN